MSRRRLWCPCRAVPCRAVPCRAVPCRAVPCRAVPCTCRAVPCRAVPCRAVPCSAVPCRAVPCRAVLCHVSNMVRRGCRAVSCHVKKMSWRDMSRHVVSKHNAWELISRLHPLRSELGLQGHSCSPRTISVENILSKHLGQPTSPRSTLGEACIR